MSHALPDHFNVVVRRTKRGWRWHLLSIGAAIASGYGLTERECRQAAAAEKSRIRAARMPEGSGRALDAGRGR